MTFKDLPARQKNEATATKKQVEFILQLAPELTATAVAKLGKWQASAFIDATLRERNDAPWFDDDDTDPCEPKTRSSCLKTAAKIFLIISAFSILAAILSPKKTANIEQTSQDPPKATPRAKESPASQRPIPTGPNVEAAKQRAIAKYPLLAVANSPLNSEFVAQVKLAQTERPHIFDEPEWPSLLAQKAHECLQKQK